MADSHTPSSNHSADAGSSSNDANEKRSSGFGLRQSDDSPSLQRDEPSDQATGNAESSVLAAKPDQSKPQVDDKGRTLNPRSCVTCRKRKVKCDKIHPCSHCRRAHIECIFPSPGRAPRKTRKLGDGKDKELLERLRRLEGVVKGLGVDVPGEIEPSRESILQYEAEGRARAGSANSVQNSPPAVENPSGQRKESTDSLYRTRSGEQQPAGRLDHAFGRLVVNEGKSRYINSSFWANLSNEVEDLKGLLNQSSDDEDADGSSMPHTSSNHQGWVFGFSSLAVNMLSLHPLPDQVEMYWQTYKENVDPLVKVLHIPTIEPIILSAATQLNNLPKGLEALIFAIYYGAITSVSPDDCLVRFGEDKSTLLARYRFAIEQALARANLLTSEEMVVLQAFVIFLICLKKNDDARVIWTLTGLVVRTAQTIGIHRDGIHFGLPPFEVEMRRRLWWQVCILDNRASEDHGCDPTIVESSFDTKLPLNINDVDITPDMTEFPPERQGCTDITFCLIRFEVSNTFRRINYYPPSPPQSCQIRLDNLTLADKEKWITECHQRLEERYLKACDMTVPLYWVTATVARLMMSKMWLMVYHPFQRQDGGASLGLDIREKLFITSLENCEYSLLLQTEARTMKWGWLFKTYVQWHALAFMLSELCQRTTGDLVDRAWVAVENMRDGRWGDSLSHTDDSRASHLWRPLNKLYYKAKEARSRGLSEEQLIRRRASNPPIRTYSPNANPMFGHPRKPQMVRAPLSNAQLQRFAHGPAYGQRPIDSHELLTSPELSSVIDVDALELPGTSLTNGTDAAVLNSNRKRSLDAMNRNAQARPYLVNDPSFLNDIHEPNSQIEPTGLGLSTTMHPTTGNVPPIAASFSSAAEIAQYPTNLPRSDPADRIDPVCMDTSGDLNWENWDQLVREFGMDVDADTPADHRTPTIGGPNWDAIASPMQQNIRMGFMGGPDVF